MVPSNQVATMRRVGRFYRGGFTLIELLVVIGIVTILFGAVFAAGTALITKARTNSTQALLVIVEQAVDEFRREQTANPTLSRKSFYTDRFGRYPPDELEIFSTLNPLFGWPARSLAVGGAEIEPPPPYVEPIKFYTRGLSSDEAAQEHRDLAAMIVAIEEFGDTSAAILNGLSNRNRSSGPLDNNNQPIQFLDRNQDGKWGQDDLQIRYVVDDWGVPISYFAQRDWVKGEDDATRSDNHDDWNEASTELIRLNGGRPVIFSYGPNGKEQLTKEVMDAQTPGGASLVGDFEDDHQINQPVNADNVYVDQGIKEKLAKGIASE